MLKLPAAHGPRSITGSCLELPSARLQVLLVLEARTLKMRMEAFRLLFLNLKSAAVRFIRAKDGNFAIVFGLLLAPLMAMVSAALDYNTASRDRAVLQASLDSAALAVARAPHLDNQQAGALLNALVQANYVPGSGRTPTIRFTRAHDFVSVNAADEVPRLMPLIMLPDLKTIRIAASSEVRWGTNDIEIALVLDNTGSMSSNNKMTELKRALCGQSDCASATPASGFVKIMRDAARRDDQVRVALVPFDTVVRMPEPMQLAVTGAAATGVGFNGGAGFGFCAHASLSNIALKSGYFRFSERDRDTRASSRNILNENVGAGCGTGRTTPATWQGCVWDRDMSANLDSTDAIAALPAVSDLHPAVNCETASLARIQPLLDIRTRSADMISALRQMTPSGTTNLAIGVSWGMAALSQREPLIEARAPSTDVRKFMILLTDGDNTESKHSTAESSIDARARLACSNAKEQGITIYAIRVINGDRTLLSQCATSPAHYKEVANASQLTPVFEQIAGEIGALRIAR